MQSYPDFTEPIEPVKTIAFAIVIAAIVFLFVNILKITRSEKKALIYTVVFFKIFVIMMVLFGFDTTLFHIIIYRRVGEATVVVNKIPVTAGMFAIITSLAALLISLGILEQLKNIAEEKVSEVIEE